MNNLNCKECGKILVGKDIKKKKCSDCRRETNKKVRETLKVAGGVISLVVFSLPILNKLKK